jgi:LacI family transcriptional regulator
MYTAQTIVQRIFRQMSASNQPVTLAEVAEAAGVSVSTASRALNGRAKAFRISQKTIDQVKEHAQRLGFQPSLLAKSLQSKRSGLLGVIVPDVSNPFFASIAREVTLHAEANGLSVLLADSRETTATEIKLLSELRSRRVEGIVVCPVGDDSKHLALADQSGTPLVLVDRCFPNTKLTSVTSDNSRGADLGIRELVKQGHKVVGCLQGRQGTSPNELRLSAIESFIQKSGLKFDSSLVSGDSFTEASGYDSTMKLLSSRYDITALFALSIPNAIGALRALSELGLQVPKDVSLVAFDDLPFADLMQTPLTTIFQDAKQLGRTAAEVIATQLRTGKKPRKRDHRVPVRLIQRESIAEVRK